MNSRQALLIFTLLAAIVGCQPATEKTIPDDLLGVWKTSEPKYADRFFEFKKDAIIFATRENNTDTYSVASIEQTHDEGGVLYNIHYLNLEPIMASSDSKIKSTSPGRERDVRWPSAHTKEDTSS